MPSVTVNSRSKTVKKFEGEIPSFSISSIYAKIGANSKLNVNRIRLTYKDKSGKHVLLDAGKTLTEYFSPQELLQELELYAKDLGPQLAWRTVFIIEYLGPLVIHLVAYAYYSLVKGVPLTQTQTIAFILAVLHFAKREYETVYVHKFSLATMPIFNLFKNSGHYWILSGVFLSYFVYSQDSAALATSGFVPKLLFHVNSLPCWANYSLAGLWLFAELSNFSAHLTLSGLRNADAKAYVIPYGYGFTWCSCPNYFFELLGWLAFALLVGNWSAWLFLTVSSVQMYLWAVKRHKRYLQTFGDEYKKLRRTAFIPFLV